MVAAALSSAPVGVPRAVQVDHPAAVKAAPAEVKVAAVGVVVTSTIRQVGQLHPLKPTSHHLQERLVKSPY